MNCTKLLLAFVLTAGTVAPSLAFEPFSLFPFPAKCWPSCVGKFCCDDYCPKPIPCSPGVACFVCPDYCAKPLPCTPLGKSAYGCDDYCPKPLPPTCYLTGKDLRCIPNRLPPVKGDFAENAMESAATHLPGVDQQLEIQPATSSRRMR